MPDPISNQIAAPTGHYDLEQSTCVASPPLSASPATPAQAALGAATGTRPMDPGAQQLVDGYAAQPNCDLQTLKAATTCAQGLVSTILAAPTGLGGIAVAAVSGFACGIVAFEAYDCYDRQP